MGKGEDFEREIPRFLSLWITDNERDDVFWRSRVRRTRHTPNSEMQLGDIIAERQEGYLLTALFNIELKSGYSKKKKGKQKSSKTKFKNIPWDLLDIIDYTERKGRKENYVPVIYDFWDQTSRDARVSSRWPMLIFKRDYHVPVVVVEKEIYQLLEMWAGDYPNKIIIFDKLVFMRFEVFFNWFRPELLQLLPMRKPEQSDRRRLRVAK